MMLAMVILGTPEALLGGSSKTTVAQKSSGAMEIKNSGFWIPHAGSWLSVVPSPSLGLHLTDLT